MFKLNVRFVLVVLVVLIALSMGACSTDSGGDSGCGDILTCVDTAHEIVNNISDAACDLTGDYSDPACQ